MSNYGAASVKIEMADAGAVLHDITAFVTSINGVEVEALTQDATQFGSAWKVPVSTGVNQVADIVISGLYDDSANTPPTLWTRGANRQFKLTYDAPTGAHFDSVTVIMMKFVRSPKMGELTTYSMTLKPTGAVTTA